MALRHVDSPSPVQINLNDTVSVHLTQYGLEIYVAHLEAFKSPLFDNEIARAEIDKTWTTELWDIMATFGPYLHMGMHEPLFVGNIITIESRV